jgi:hypothetical protein
MELERPQVTITGGPPRDDDADLLASTEPLGPRVRAAATRALSWEPRRDLRRPLLAAAAAVLVAASASAVALELRPASTDPADVLAATLGAERYRVELRSEVVEARVAQPFDRGGDAVVDVDLARDAFRFVLRPLDAGAPHGRFEVIGIGDTTWTRVGDPTGGVSPWQRQDGQDGGFGVVGTAEGLRQLFDGATRVRSLTRGEVRGVDVRRLVVALQPPDDADDRDRLSSGDEVVEAEMSVDDAGRLRRLIVVDDGDEVRLRTTVELTRFGVDPRIEPPADEDVVET